MARHHSPPEVCRRCGQEWPITTAFPCERPCHDDEEMFRCAHYKRRKADGFQGGKLAVLFAAALAGVVSTPTALHARSKKVQWTDAPHSKWYEAQKDCEDNGCCGRGDASSFEGNYTNRPDGSVALDDGRIVPACKVLKGSNPTGHAVLWQNGSGVLCFARGPGS